MDLYKHDVFENNMKINTKFTIDDELPKEVKVRNNTYIRETLEGFGNKKYILHYSRRKDVFKDGDKYFKEDENKNKIEINIEEYKNLKKEYNYFVLIDCNASEIYTADTSEKTVTINIDVVNAMLNKNLDAHNRINYSKLEKGIKVDSIKIKSKKPKQRKLFGAVIEEELYENTHDVLGADDMVIELSNMKNNSLFDKLISTKGNTDIKYSIDARDQHGKFLKIDNKSISYFISINEKDIKKMSMEEIKYAIKEYFNM